MTSGDDSRKFGTGPHAPSDARDGGGPPAPVLGGARRRTYAPPGSGARDRHELDRVQRLRALVLSGAGGILGFVLGLFLAIRFPTAPGAVLYPFLVAGVGWAFVLAVVVVVSGGAGRLAGTIYMPGGAGAGRREYSFAESLVARGSYEDAVSAFELAVGEHPDDPLPYLRIARICRDHLGDPGRAARWFRRARDESAAGEAQTRAITRELVELHRRAGQPTRAAPELARLAELHPDTAEGRWAADELAEVKRLIAEENG